MLLNSLTRLEQSWLLHRILIWRIYPCWVRVSEGARKKNPKLQRVMSRCIDSSFIHSVSGFSIALTFVITGGYVSGVMTLNVMSDQHCGVEVAIKILRLRLR